MMEAEEISETDANSFFTLLIVREDFIELALCGRMNLNLLKKEKKKAIPVTGREGPDVEAPTFCLDSRLTDGGKVVIPTRRPPFTPQEGSWYSFLLEAESTPGP
jgi:hypothetical protein